MNIYLDIVGVPRVEISLAIVGAPVEVRRLTEAVTRQKSVFDHRATPNPDASKFCILYETASF